MTMDTLMHALRREAQTAFLRDMLAAGTAWSDLDPTQRTQAERLGWKLPTFRPRRENAAPAAWSGRVL